MTEQPRPHETQAEETGARLLALHAQGQRPRDFDATGASLNSANLNGLRGDAIRLCNADLSGANLQRVRLVECDFRAANLAGADLSESVMRICTFDDAHAPDARLEGARIEDSSLRGADFSRARLRGARLTESSWARACLRAADLAESEGDGVEFRGADLSGASLASARLVDADFRGADLTGADLSGGDFRGADFRGAILDDVRREGTLFIGARFDVEQPGVEAVWRAAGRVTAPGETPETASASASDSRDQEAAAALAELVLHALSASGQGTSNLGPKFAQVKAKLEAWRSQTGEASLGDMSQLFESIEGSLGAAAALPPEATKSFSVLLRSIEEADDLEPPAEWKAWLQKLFPAVAQDEDGEALDALASTLLTILKKGERDESDINKPNRPGP